MNPLKWLLVTVGAALIYGTVVIIDMLDPKFDLSLATRSFIQSILCVAGAVTGLAVVLERRDRAKFERLDRLDRRLDAMTNIITEHRLRMERDDAQALDGYARGYADGLAKQPMRPQLQSINGKTQ